jgi:hypothetical protein
MPHRVNLRFRVDLFAYTLMSLSFGWVLMNLLHAWTLDLYIQCFIVLAMSVMWALYAHLALAILKRYAAKRAALQAELATVERRKL